MSGAFQGVTSEDGWLTATRDDGGVVRFTRRERALLRVLTSAPGRLFDRDKLLDALCARGSDRTIDYVVNRLRAKLGDTDAERRFISTQYGEGYVWVAPPREEASPPFFTVTAARGGNDEGLVEALRAALQARLGRAHRVTATGSAARFRVEASVHTAAGGLHAALALRDGDSGEVVTTSRLTSIATAAVEVSAAHLIEAAWRRLALPPAAAGPTDPPLHLRLHAAAALMDPSGSVVRRSEETIAAMREKDPADPVLAITWAMHRFTRVTLATEPLDVEAEDAFAEEVESLVLGALPAVRDDPVLALAAAKLLLGIHRGHHDLAEALARSAFAESAAFAAAFPMLGQIRACAGDLAEAVTLFDQGLALCEPGSQFEAYIQVLKASTLVAADDWPGVEAIYDRLCEVAGPALPLMAPLFVPAGDDGLARRITPFIDRFDEAQARRSVSYAYHRGARYFRVPAHAANVLRGPLTHFVRRFGPGVVSDDVWRAAPEELLYLRGGRTIPK